MFRAHATLSRNILVQKVFREKSAITIWMNMVAARILIAPIPRRRKCFSAESSHSRTPEHVKAQIYCYLLFLSEKVVHDVPFLFCFGSKALSGPKCRKPTCQCNVRAMCHVLCSSVKHISSPLLCRHCSYCMALTCIEILVSYVFVYPIMVIASLLPSSRGGERASWMRTTSHSALVMLSCSKCGSAVLIVWLFIWSGTVTWASVLTKF